MEREWIELVLTDGSGVYVACQLRPDWIAVGFYAWLDGSLHLADLALVPGQIPPAERATPFGPSRGTWLADRDYIERSRTIGAIAKTKPPRAIFARLLRMVPLEEMQTHAIDVARSAAEAGKEARAQLGAQLDEWGVTARGMQYVDQFEDIADKLSPAKREYLEAAVRFAELSPGLTRPVMVVGNEMGISQQQLSDRLSAARKLKWLTSPGKGRKGGELTALGAALAARHIGKRQENK